MNESRDTADGPFGVPRQPAAPDVRKSTDAGPQRDQSQVAALLQAIASEISESDQRQGLALADLRARLETIVEHQAPRDLPANPAPAATAGGRPPASPLSDLRKPAVAAARQPAAAAIQPAAGLDQIYAAVAQSYSEAASLRQPGAPMRASRRPAVAELPAADAPGDDFLDLSALAEPHLPPSRALHGAGPRAAAPAASVPAVTASLAIEKSIGELTRRVAETEQRVSAALDSRNPGTAGQGAGMNAHIEALRAELDRLAGQHEKVSVEVGEISANVKSLSEAAGRIGPIADTVDHLNEAILALRKDMPGFAETAAERAVTQVAARATEGTGHADLTEKLAIVQDLLLAQSREQQENDGRSLGALESIRGLVQNLHNRIDALEAGEPELVSDRPTPSPAPAVPSRASFGNIPPTEPTLADPIEPLPGAVPPISREDLIASARRAAMAASQAPAAAQAHQAAAGRDGDASAPIRAAAQLGRLGARPIVTVAMVALLVAGMGMVYAKLVHKAAPAVAIEQAKLPAMPEDLPDATPAKKPTAGTAAVATDASQTAADPAPAATAPPAKDPGKVSSLSGDGQTEMAANASTLPDAGTSAPRPVTPSDLQTPKNADPAAALPAAIAPLSVRTAALSGDPAAAYMIAERYLRDKAMPRDAAKAEHWYEQSAKGDYPLAEFRLGVMYEKGDDGIAADRAQALSWYRRAAESGNVQAMHNLAVLYANQPGTPDYGSAAKWFEQAASYNLKDSQYNLAILCLNGLGMTKDVGAAYKWFAIGAAHGDSDAAKQRDDLRKNVPAATLAKIEAQINAWHPKLPDHKANFGELPGADTTSMTPADGASAASSEVSQVQRMLLKLGYDPGAFDGTLTAQTSEAIRSFEQRSGLTVDGEITDELVAKLKGLAG